MNRATARKHRAVYYIGSDCKRGHTSPRYTKTGACAACDILRKINTPIDKIRAQQKKAEDKRRGKRTAYHRRQYHKKKHIRNQDRYVRPRYKSTHRKSTQKRRKLFAHADILRDCDETKLIIDEIYRRAQVLTAQTGVVYSVDHIVPINHPKVCGLHIPCNLQVITLEENVRKSNKFEQ